MSKLSRRFGVTWTIALAAFAAALLPLGTSHAAAGVTINSIDGTDELGRLAYNMLKPALSFSLEGNPVVAFFANDGDDLRIAFCADPACSQATVKNLDPGPVHGKSLSLVVEPNGNAVVFYRSEVGGRIVVCQDPACNSLARPSFAGGTGLALALDSNGYPVASYVSGLGDLKAYHCFDAACNEISDIAVTKASANQTSISTNADGNLVINYQTALRDANIVICGDASCAPELATVTPLDTQGDVGQNIAGSVTADNLPVASYYDADNSVLRVGSCTTTDCDQSGAVSATIDSEPVNAAAGTSLALTPDGLPVIAYPSTNNGGELRFAACGQSDCTSSNYITVLDSGGPVSSPSLGINPVTGQATAAYIMDGSLKLAVCDSADCGASQSGQQEPASNTRAAGFATPGLATPGEQSTPGVSVNLPRLPAGPGWQLATDLRYVVGSKVCGVAGNQACDAIWHPPVP